jgi:hypothetical protein
MKTILKFSLAVVVAGLLTACAMTGLRECNAVSPDNGINLQTNAQPEWANRATGQFLDQLASAAVR